MASDASIIHTISTLSSHFPHLESIHDYMRARRALTLFQDVPLRTRRVLSLYKVYGNSALLVLNWTSLNSDNALLVLNEHLWRAITPFWFSADDISIEHLWTAITPFWFSTGHLWRVIMPFWFSADNISKYNLWPRPYKLSNGFNGATVLRESMEIIHPFK